MVFAYRYLYEYLYVSIAFAPKVNSCKIILDSDICHLIVYVGLWLSELPLLLAGFSLFYIVTIAFLRQVSWYCLKYQFVFFGYLMVYLIMTALSEYGLSMYAVLSGSFQAVVSILVLFAAVCLTSRLSKDAASGAV